MNKHPHCPVSFQKADETAARITAAIVFIFSLLYLVQPHWATAAVLFVDFSLRSFDLTAYSVFARIGRWASPKISTHRKFVDAAPKQFAALIGFLLTDLLLIASIVLPATAGRPLAFVLLCFSFLESAFGFCAACKLYPYVKNVVGNGLPRQQLD